jgi:hypothetical protein
MLATNLKMGSSPVSRNPSNLRVSQKDAHPLSEYACEDYKPRLDCQIKMMGEASSQRGPTDQTSLTSLSFKDPSRVPEFPRNCRITCSR